MECLQYYILLQSLYFRLEHNTYHGKLSENKQCTTGDIVTVDLGKNLLINHTKGKEFVLKPIGDAGPVIDAGGIFAYARKTGMISSVA